MSLEVTGKLLQKGETQQVSEKFKKREFVLELVEEINGNLYSNFAKMQLVQNKCEIIDRFKEGEQVKVSFNIKGNRWERDGKVNYITNLDAWRMEAAGGQQQQAQQTQQYQAPPMNNTGHYTPSQGQPANNFPSPESIDDLPF